MIFSPNLFRRAACVLLFGAIAAGCGKKPGDVIPPALAQRCVVIRDASTAWAAWLDRVMPGAARYPLRALDEAMEACLASDAALVMEGGDYDDATLARLESYMARGARLIIAGPAHPLAGRPASIREAGGLGGLSYNITSSTFRVYGETETSEWPSVAVTSPSPPPRGYGGVHAHGPRWIPVVEVLDGSGAVMGWAASVTLTPQDGEGFSVAGWAGFDVPTDSGKMLPLLVRLIQETTRDVYLYQYGLDRHALDAREPARVTARLLDRRKIRTPLRLVARWVNSSGTEIRRHVSPPLASADGPVDVSVGLAPEEAGHRVAMYRLELLARDRNDQMTYDMASHPVKVFPLERRGSTEPVTVDGGQLVQGRKPVFLLGVNYWPRVAAPRAGSSANGHWLNPEWFNPDVVTSDLDLMTSAGINAIAIEYTDARQAPQLRYLLDELRARSMWASVYLPALHPLDLRLEAALAMLQAVDLAQWPEVVALELARGIHVPPRVELRRLDDAWADWLAEHFVSAAGAEHMLGVTLWRERNRLAGPPDAQLHAGPHQDRAVALYYSFLRDYASRRVGHARRALRAAGYATLITARTAYEWPEARPAHVLDTLDAGAGAVHLDFLSPDAWSIHPLLSMHDDSAAMAAYLRGLGGSKPVVWAAFGQDAYDGGARQKEVFQHFMETFLREGASGAFVWRYATGRQEAGAGDWGLMLPQGRWRPVEEAMRVMRLQLRRPRPKPPAPVRETAPLIQSTRQWRDLQKNRAGIFAPSDRVLPVTEWMPPGHGLGTADLLDKGRRRAWSPIDGLHLLNAEWGSVRTGDATLPRAPGENVRTYAGRRMQLDIINSGTVRWAPATGGARRDGTVWFHVNQPGSAEEWLPSGDAASGSTQVITWTPREPGLWEIQPFLAGYGKFGERLLVEVTTPPGLF